MTLTDKLNWCMEAHKWTQTNSVIELLEQSRQQIEKLEQDRKVLRWALMQAREALLHSNQTTVLSIIETAESMTEPANDR